MEEIYRAGNCLIVGDFNIDWLGSTTHRKRLNDIIEDNYFKQIVIEPTRITENSSSLIDYAVTNIENISVKTNNSMKISDHESLEIKIPLRNYGDLLLKKNISCLYYSNAVLRNAIIYGELKNISPSISINDFTKELSSEINNALASMVRDKNVNRSNNLNFWFNNNLRELKQRKIQSYNLAIWYNNEYNWMNYKRIRNQYKSELRKSKAHYVQNKINECTNQKDMWRVIKKLVLQKDDSKVKEIEVDGSIIRDDLRIAQELNAFFVNSVNEISESIPYARYVNRIENYNEDFRFNIISMAELKTTMKVMNNKRDLNYLSIKMLLNNFDIVGPYLHHLVMESLQQGVVPNVLKESCIIPIKKVNSTKSPSEIRPVNMLSTISKILEKVVYNQLVEHMESNKLIYETQSGFRKDHNCESLLNLVVSDWKIEIEKKRCVVAVFLDLKRAFEVVDRDILLNKLERYGVRNNELSWFKSYLSNRSQRTKCGNFISDAKDVHIGVPQGAVLGTLLFLIYMNDLPKVVAKSKVCMFADDTLIYLCGENPNECVQWLNEDLMEIEKYLQINRIKLNTNKTKAMIIKGNSTHKIRLENVDIERVSEIKYLGVIMDDKLSFIPHFEYICKKISKKIAFLRRFRYKLTSIMAINIYNTIIKPHFEYCSTILFLGNQQMRDRLQKLQNKGMRCILQCHRLTHVQSMLEALQWLSINQRLLMNILLFIFKIKNNMLPNYMHQYLTTIADVQPYTLRNANDFRINFSSSSFGQNMLFHKGLKKFNEMPQELKNETNIYIFKRKVITYVKQLLL